LELRGNNSDFSCGLKILDYNAGLDGLVGGSVVETSLTWSLLVDSLPEEVAGHADLRLGPLDRDQTVVTPRLDIFDCDVGLGLCPDLTDPLTSRTNDGSSDILGYCYLSGLAGSLISL